MPVTAKTPKPAAKAAAKAAPKAAKKPKSALGKLLSGKKAPAKAVPAIGLVEMRVDRLWPSPLNPRKAFDPEAINELAASIKADGQVYQNLVARANPGPDGATHEIIAGERRFRSVTQLIAAGDWKASDTVPVRVITADDAKFIEIATLENMQRRDLTPLEEARAFGQLRDLGRTTDQIAEAVGMSLRHVQVRLQLVDTLTPAGQSAMERGDISLAQARALMLEKDPELQDSFLVSCLDERTWESDREPRAIRHSILANCAPVAAAIFPLEQYVGDFLVDDGDEEVRYFKDRGQFRKLQQTAIDALEKKLRAEWAWVEVARGYFDDYSYVDGPEPADRTVAGVIVKVDYDLSVKVEENRVKRPKATAAKNDTPTPQPPFTKPQLIYAKNRKTEALQDAVAADPRTAKVLACVALMGARDVTRITANAVGDQERVCTATLDAMQEGAAARLPEGLFNGDKKPGSRLRLKSSSEYVHHVGAQAELEAYEAVKALDDADLDQLFTALVAPQVGSFDGFPPCLGDSPLAVKLAADLKIEMNARWFIDDEYLALLRKPRLREIIDTAWPCEDAATTKDRDKMTAAQLRTAITLRAHMVLPRELQFGTEAELDKGKAINFGPDATGEAVQAAE